MELNRDAIKKALDWLDSLVGNSYDSDIALFTYQLLGILYDTCEELTEENERLASLCTSKDVIIGDMNAENVRLRAEISVKKKLLDKSVEVEDKVKADTVREMSKRIKEYFPYDADSGLYVVLDQITEEMIGEIK